MHSNRKAIAAYTGYQMVKMKWHFQASSYSSVVTALGFNASIPGFNPQRLQWNSFKKYKILFLIEDISELES
jgi:hypothetical protein